MWHLGQKNPDQHQELKVWCLSNNLCENKKKFWNSKTKILRRKIIKNKMKKIKKKSTCLNSSKRQIYSKPHVFSSRGECKNKQILNN